MPFTGTDIPVALVMLDEIMLGDGMTNVKQKIPAETIKAIVETQTVDIDPVRPNDPCTEVDAGFYRSSASNFVYSGTGPDAAQGCELVTGPEHSTEKLRLDNNYHIKSAFSLEAPRCNNASTAAMEVAKGLANCFATNRRRLNNEFAIPLLANNLQPNQADAKVVDGITVDSGNLLKMDPSGFTAEGAIRLELLATNNYFTSPVMVTGGNFYVNDTLAQFRALDDDKRSLRAMFGNTNMYFDPQNLEAAVAQFAGINEAITFVFDPSVMCHWSTQLYDSQVLAGDNPAQAEDPSTNYYVFTVEDQMVPGIYHNIEMEWKCVRRQGKSGRKVYGWEYNVTTLGGLHLAPSGYIWPVDESVPGAADLTGILGVACKA